MPYYSKQIRAGLTQMQRKPRLWDGLAGNGSGVVDVPQRAGYVYVRVWRGAGYEVGIFENPSGLYLLENTPVIVSDDPVNPMRQFVERIDDLMTEYQQMGRPTVPVDTATRPHRQSHYLSGTDPLLGLHTLQLQGMRVEPAATAQTIRVKAGVYYINGAFGMRYNDTDVDVSTYYKAAPTLNWIVVYLDSTGAVAIHDANTANLTQVTYPSGAAYVLAVVRLRPGMAWQWPDDFLADARFLPQDTGTTFLALLDTPDTYIGQAGKAPLVNTGETALEFVDVLTPAEHTAIGNASPHHAPVTLDANADTLLSLSTQQLGLDTQAANRAFAGPTSGAAAVPTFRALVAADLPAATEAAQGAVELATLSETQTGLDGERAVTPAGLRADVPATPAASRGVRLDASGHAQLPGRVYQAAYMDTHPDADALGLQRRAVNRVGINAYNDHFRSGTIPTSYAWQSSPFNGTPGTLNYSAAGEYLSVSDTTANRYFMSIAVTNAAASWQSRSFYGRFRCATNGLIGIRLDDGTDNNYVEVLTDGTANDATMTIVFRYRAGGGAVTTVTSAVNFPASEELVLRLGVSSAYTASGYMAAESGSSINVAGFSVSIAGWAPAAGRVGVMFEAVGNSNPGTADWIYRTFT